MPQMMPINWLMIFFSCLMCLIILITMMNSLLVYFKLKNNLMYNNLIKKWKWLW